MRVLLYEWCCSGGLQGPDRDVFLDADADANLVAGIAREGRAMFRAALVDAARARNMVVEALVDATRPLDLPVGAIERAVAPGEELARLREAANVCDVTIIVAPETAGILERRVTAVRNAGGTVIAPDTGFISTAADKQATILALAAAGVPIPPGRMLDGGAPWPADFVRPAVGKRLDGVGCDGLVSLGSADITPAVRDHPMRLEAAVAGTSVGVACLCGAGRIVPLPPLEQRFVKAPEPMYVGGAPLVDPSLRDRAVALARRSVAGLMRVTNAAARGWVGVDLVLGSRRDGRDDRVLEINPRLTTSFVGHAFDRDHSLIERIIRVASDDADSAGDPPHHDPQAFEVADAERSACV